MRWGLDFYKRRRPWVGMPPGPTLAVDPALVVPGPARRHGGLVAWVRPPVKFVPPPAVRPLQPLVVSPSASRPGKVLFTRQLKPPVANVAGAVRQARVWRYEPPLQVRQGKTFLARLPEPPTAPPSPGQRQWWLKAGVTTKVSLQAGVLTSWRLKASAVMSISAKLNFFQGEDITLNFALTPPQDITGWTLSGTIKNQLGGTTQFTFTPTIVDAGRGIFQAVWSRTNTTNLTPGDYVWDIRRTDSGNNSVLAHGEATVKQPVTA